MKALIAEEESISREIVSLYLLKNGFEVVTASDGIEALELFGKEGPFNVVITALDLPHLNGIELSRSLKRDYKYDASIILLSDREDEQERTEAIEAGVDAYLIRPLTEIMIIQTIKDISGKHLPRR